MAATNGKTPAQLKQTLNDTIDAQVVPITGIAERILGHPETGYKEFETAGLVDEWLTKLAIPHETGIAVTGVKAVLDTGRPGPSVAIMGELDALPVPDHPHADPKTGAAHACGHNNQIASMLGAAIGFTQSDVLDHLCGKLVFMAVPAEEYVEVGFRQSLRDQGTIEFLGGKPEFIRNGAFDDVDFAMLVHTTSNPDDGVVCMTETSNGTVAKHVSYHGRAAHAAGAPHKGINALNAATLAFTAIQFQRETFRDEDTVRAHFIIKRGGDVNNVIPALAQMEGKVRGKTMDIMLEANEKVQRALKAGALATGATVHIETFPGYFPMISHPPLADLYRENAAALVGEKNISVRPHSTGSTDMGDVMHVVRAIQPAAGGATGTGHGNDFLLADADHAIVAPAKLMALTAIDLLSNGGESAQRVMEETEPPFTKDGYLAQLRSMANTEEYSGA
jgi:amidohydrolase